MAIVNNQFQQGALISFPAGNTRVIDYHITDIAGVDVDVSALTTTGIQAFIYDSSWTAKKTYAIGTGITVGSGATVAHAYLTILAADTNTTALPRGFSGFLEVVVIVTGQVETIDRRPLALL